jgi:D-lactate dehydrogenase
MTVNSLQAIEVPDQEALERELRQILGPQAVSIRPIDLHAHAHDASHYLLVPRLLVTPSSAADVSALFAACTRAASPVTFRSGGTSLSGQAVTGAVMADTRHGFRDIEVLEGGSAVRVQPGVTVRAVNARLLRYGRKIGPDPASEGSCTVGGVVANNSSGMHCGTTQNTYRTLRSMRFVLPSGTVIDSGAPDASREFAAREPGLHEGLLRLRRRILDSPHSVATIERMFAMKNTMGYGLNAFLDFSEPLDILVHLIIGSEGTLAFIAEAVFNTIEIKSQTASGLLIFPGIAAATAAVPGLVDAGMDTAELMDPASLRVSARVPGCPEEIRTLDLPDPAALLVEFAASTPEELQERCHAADSVLAGLPLSRPHRLTHVPSERAGLWKVRKGLYSAVAGARPPGTNQLLEDVAVPVAALAQTCGSLTELFTSTAIATRSFSATPRTATSISCSTSASTIHPRWPATSVSPRTWWTWCWASAAR